MNDNYFILMADIIGSSSKESVQLSQSFKIVVDEVNKKFKKQLISPLTITLGDEFQGIIDNLHSSIEIIFELEETIIKYGFGFKMKYILNYGRIETAINREIAYGMLGEGLADTRELLSKSKSKNKRFYFKLNYNVILEDKINLAFLMYQYFIDNWKVKDSKIIYEFINGLDYKKIAAKFDKDVSLMWRRNESLNINEYLSIKKLIFLEVQNDKYNKNIFELGETVKLRIKNEKNVSKSNSTTVEVVTNNGDNVIFKMSKNNVGRFNNAEVIDPIRS